MAYASPLLAIIILTKCFTYGFTFWPVVIELVLTGNDRPGLWQFSFIDQSDKLAKQGTTLS